MEIIKRLFVPNEIPPIPPCLNSKDETFSPQSCTARCSAITTEGADVWGNLTVKTYDKSLCTSLIKTGDCPCEEFLRKRRT